MTDARLQKPTHQTFRPNFPTLDAASLMASIARFGRTMNTPRNFLIYLFVLGVCVSLGCVHPARAAREKMSDDIQQIMTPEEFKAAGLNKLSPEELAKLNA